MRMTTPAVFLILFTFEKTVADCVDVVVLVFSFLGFYHERIGLKKTKK
jgi:hypothetical protein